jgi:hypothetical protein
MCDDLNIGRTMTVAGSCGGTVEVTAFPGRVCIEPVEGGDSLPVYLSVEATWKLVEALVVAIGRAERPAAPVPAVRPVAAGISKRFAL